jgi:diamine N-acetyltransferase
MLNGKQINLRPIEKTDLNCLYKWENDSSNWEVSGTLVPYSKKILMDFIEESHKDIFTTKQFRFIIETTNQIPIGTIDLFHFEPIYRRAGVGILIGEKAYRQKGCASEALYLLEVYCKNVLKLHQLYCHIDEKNIPSIQLFLKMGYQKTGVKKDWILDFNNTYCNVGFYQKIIDE